MSRHRAPRPEPDPLGPSAWEILGACAFPLLVLGVGLLTGVGPGWVIAGLSGLCVMLAVIALVYRRLARRPLPVRSRSQSWELMTSTEAVPREQWDAFWATGNPQARFASRAEVDALIADELPRWSGLMNRLEADENRNSWQGGRS